MSNFFCNFAAVMTNNISNQQNSPIINWPLILKVAIAVLTAIAGAIGVSKSEAVTDMVNGIIGKE